MMCLLKLILFIILFKLIKKCEFSLDFFNESGKETNDVKYTQKETEDYVDLILIFQHKGKYRAEI